MTATNEIAVQHFLQIDKLNVQIAVLTKEKQAIFNSISNLKKQLEKEHSYLIGRSAIVVNSDNLRSVECTCTAVMALDDCSGVRPLFSRKGQKISADSYEWI
jgi:hypothetical protein